MNEQVPLADIFREVYTFLRGREDTALFGSQAVNAYVSTPRSTEDVDIMFCGLPGIVEELSAKIGKKFHIATRVREVVPGGYRIYQLCKPKNRHLVDMRQVSTLPITLIKNGIQILTPHELLAGKLIALSQRAAQPKGITDGVDIHRLLLAYPQLKTEQGLVHDELLRKNASPSAIAKWREYVAADLQPDVDEGY